MIKILHVIYSLELGGGPVHIKKLVSDIPGQHFVAGGMGNMIDEFETILGKECVFGLTGGFSDRRNQIKEIDTKISPDIIHVHGRGASILVRLSNIPRKSGRIIYTIHGFHAENGPLLKRTAYKWIELALYHRTAKFIHVSKVEMQEFMQFLGKKNAIRHQYLPNYIEPQAPTPEPPLPGINFMYVGRLSPEKGIDILLDALTQLPAYPDVSFHIIGDGPDREKYEQILKEKQTANKISFLGPLRNAAAIMPRYQAVIIPSRKEGLPYVLLEAMAARVPVISTPEKTIVSVLPPGQPFISKSFSPGDLAKSIQSFIEAYPAKGATISQLIEDNYKALMEGFSKEKTVVRFNELYKNVLSETGK